MTKISKFLLFVFCLLCLITYISSVSALEIQHYYLAPSILNNNTKTMTLSSTNINYDFSLSSSIKFTGYDYVQGYITTYIQNTDLDINSPQINWNITCLNWSQAYISGNDGTITYQDGSHASISYEDYVYACSNYETSISNRIDGSIENVDNHPFMSMQLFTSTGAYSLCDVSTNGYFNCKLDNNDREYNLIRITLSKVTPASHNAQVTINRQWIQLKGDTSTLINNNSLNTQQLINNQNQNSQNTQQKIDNIDNTLKDSSIDNPSSSTSSWANKNATNGVITNLLTLPIKLMQGYVNGMNSSCSAFNLGTLFGTDIILPCINVSNLIGSSLWSVIDILFSGFMIFAIGKKLIKIFNDFTNMKSNQVDELYGGGA